MTQSSLSQSLNDTPQQQDVIEIKQYAFCWKKSDNYQRRTFSGRFKLIGPQKYCIMSLREVAREAGIAPNSFYRHFKDIDELAISLIDRAGIVLRKIIREARQAFARKHYS
jgi:AraC-like DNA-binding protein